MYQLGSIFLPYFIICHFVIVAGGLFGGVSRWTGSRLDTPWGCQWMYQPCQKVSPLPLTFSRIILTTYCDRGWSFPFFKGIKHTFFKYHCRFLNLLAFANQHKLVLLQSWKSFEWFLFASNCLQLGKYGEFVQKSTWFHFCLIFLDFKFGPKFEFQI